MVPRLKQLAVYAKKEDRLMEQLPNLIVYQRKLSQKRLASGLKSSLSSVPIKSLVALVLK